MEGGFMEDRPLANVTIEEHNRNVHAQLLKKLDPDLYALWDIIKNSRVTTYIAAKHILAIDKVLRSGMGFGKVITSVQKGNVDTIRIELVERVEGALDNV